MRRLWIASLLLTFACPALAASETPMAAFNRSEAGMRLASLGLTVLDALPLGPDEVLVAAYQPELGPLNDWDDETRLTLYKRDGARFVLGQFLSKAGKSPKGRLGGWVLQDLDGDGMSELLVIGRAGGPFGRVDTQIYRRDRRGEPFSLLWSRQERGAAFRLERTRLLYTWEERGSAVRRRFERYVLRDGALRSEGSSE